MVCPNCGSSDPGLLVIVGKNAWRHCRGCRFDWSVEWSNQITQAAVKLWRGSHANEYQLITKARQLVERAGGLFKCVQQVTEPDGAHLLVFFNSPATDNSLAMELDNLTVERVREHIRQSDEKFKKG